MQVGPFSITCRYTYVIDGVMHSDVIKSDLHSTDTHGYSEVIFGTIHLLGLEFAPRIKALAGRSPAPLRTASVTRSEGTAEPLNP